MLHLVLSSSAAIVYVIGGLFMARTGFSALILVYTCFLVGASLQTLATQQVNNMSLTYIITLGLEAMLSVAVGSWLLKEKFSVQSLTGVGLVIAGVAILRSQGK